MSGGYAGVFGPIELYVDFTTGTVIANLTIPSLGTGITTSPPEHYTPEGDITPEGKKEPASYVLTEGVSFSADAPFIALSGSFRVPDNTTGSFDANFCCQSCDTGVYVGEASPERFRQ